MSDATEFLNGLLGRIWIRGARAYHGGFQGSFDIPFITICGIEDYGPSWVSDDEAMYPLEDRPPRLCRNCARVLRTAAKEADRK